MKKTLNPVILGTESGTKWVIDTTASEHLSHRCMCAAENEGASVHHFAKVCTE